MENEAEYNVSKKENIQSISKSAECLRMCKAEPLKSGFQK